MLKISSLETFKSQTNPKIGIYNTARANKENIADNNLKGVLLNTYIKDGGKSEDFSNFDEISSRLLIPESYSSDLIKQREKTTELFDIKKALKPVMIAGGITLASIVGISCILKNYSKVLANDVAVVRPPDLARNINILEEPHFAFYQALRDPSARKIMGFAGVGIMSVLTIGAKNFAEGVKDVWIKKQNCNIEHDLQENLINVETEVFSGKLEVVNTLLKDTTEYFKNVLSDKKPDHTNFKSYLSFKGKDGKENKFSDDVTLSKKNILFLAGSIAGIIGLSALLFKNASKTHSNLKDFEKKFSHLEIQSNLEKAIEESKDISKKNNSITKLVNILKTTNATDDKIEENLNKINGITPEELAKAKDEIKSSQIYEKASEAMGGISGKIQYYCYINEERGHLYNWILNPENKFNKFIFLGFCAISATGYVLKNVADAIKDVTVSKQNAKSELNLRKDLITTEINNFKAKKLSAITPLIDNFNYQLKKGKSKEELKELAENILSEIKNGPPYVYS